MTQNFGLNQTRISLLAQGMLTSQELQLRALKRAESLAQSARSLSKKSFIKSKRNKMTPSLTIEANQMRLIQNLSSSSASDILMALLHLVKWVMDEETSPDMIHSRIATLIEAGVSRRALWLLSYEVRLMDSSGTNCTLYNQDGEELAGTVEKLELMKEHACHLFFGLSLGH